MYLGFRPGRRQPRYCARRFYGLGLLSGRTPCIGTSISLQTGDSIRISKTCSSSLARLVATQGMAPVVKVRGESPTQWPLP